MTSVLRQAVLASGVLAILSGSLAGDAAAADKPAGT